MRWPLILGALFAMLAVMAGAFGAHGLRALVSERGLEIFQTGATYQMYHALGLILIALLAVLPVSRRLLGLAAGFFTAGIVLFSGSLYLLVLTETPSLGAVTPIGGVCFIAGWALLIAAGALASPCPTE
ncbi:DUF423 domain-containing protein [Marinobacter sp.]|uniref:DUF423 domain-containing protein n=1 Tax=Marinobacter sp. TaxID=50741 RepID=UPI0038514D72